MTNPFANPWTEPTAQTSSVFLDPLPNPYRVQMTPHTLGPLGDSPMSPEALQAAYDRVSSSPWFWLMRVAGVVGGIAGVYHGYKRNHSVGWALGWGLFGGLFPFITIPLSIAQGFAKPKASKGKKSNRRQRNGKRMAPVRRRNAVRRLSNRSVSFNADNISDFRAVWPASGLGSLKSVWFQFAKNGDLIDMETKPGPHDRFDGEALRVLSDDAQKWLETGKKPYWLHSR